MIGRVVVSIYEFLYPHDYGWHAIEGVYTPIQHTSSQLLKLEDITTHQEYSNKSIMSNVAVNKKMTVTIYNQKSSSIMIAILSRCTQLLDLLCTISFDNTSNKNLFSYNYFGYLRQTFVQIN